MKIQRYEIYSCSMDSEIQINAKADGDFVYSSDHLKQIAELEQKLAVAENQFKDWTKQSDYWEEQSDYWEEQYLKLMEQISEQKELEVENGTS
jgi:hypothetical protein